jgi:Pectinacetylesterase
MRNATSRRRAVGAAGAVVAACVAAAALADDASSWTTVPGGPGTGCAALATPYEFYVHPGDKRRVAIYFQGGGGCWNERNCGLTDKQTFDATIDDADRPWLSKPATGVFDVADARNPLREYTIVMAPYCTADVHLGVRTGRFETADGKRVDIQYRGLANAQGVMDWVAAHHPELQSIFVTGGSAGAIPSPVFASQMARRYPAARVVQLGDGAGGYRTARIAGLFAQWGAVSALKNDPLYRDLDPATANFEDLYLRAAATPNLRLAQLNSAEDQIQVFFLGQLGHKVTTLAPLLSGNLQQLRAANPELRTYTMPGVVHTLLRRPDFYTANVGGVALTQWLDDLLQGRAAQNVGDELLPAPAERLQ